MNNIYFALDFGNFLIFVLYSIGLIFLGGFTVMGSKSLTNNQIVDAMQICVDNGSVVKNLYFDGTVECENNRIIKIGDNNE